MKISRLVSVLAWHSVFVLGFLGATRTILVDGLLIGYWSFCLFAALVSSLMNYERKM